MRVWQGLLAAAACGVAGAVPVTAQLLTPIGGGGGPNLNRLYGDNRVAGGPQINEGRGFLITAEVDADAESNLLREGSAASRSGTSRADARLTPDLDVEYGQPFGRQQLFLNGNIGYDYYVKNTQLNRERAQVNGGVSYRLGPCSGVAYGSYDRRQSSFEDLNVVVPNLQQREEYSLSAACRLGPSIRPNATVTRLVVDNSLAARGSANLRGTTYQVGVDYVRPVLGTIGLFVSRSIYNYPGASRVTAFELGLSPTFQFIDVPTATSADGLTSTQAGFSYSRTLGTRIKLAASVFYLIVDPKLRHFFIPDPAAPGLLMPGSASTTNTIGYSLTAEYAPSPRLSGELDLSRSAIPPQAGLSTYSISTRSGVEVNYKLSRRIATHLDLSAIARDLKGEPLGPNLIAGEPLLRGNDTVVRLDTGVDLTFGRLLTAGVSAIYSQRFADNRAFNYNSYGGRITVRVQI